LDSLVELAPDLDQFCGVFFTPICLKTEANKKENKVIPAELLRTYLKKYQTDESLGKYSTITLKEEEIQIDHR
jgi:hypothetical protein